MSRLILRVRLRLARGLTLRHPVWTWVVVIGAVLRATSYAVRPPTPSPTSARIEGLLPYPAWVALLLTVAALLAVGTVRGCASVTWVGHMLGVFTSWTLAASIGLAAVFDGEPWSGAWPLVVVALVHWGRGDALGEEVRAQLDARHDRRVNHKARR